MKKNYFIKNTLWVLLSLFSIIITAQEKSEIEKDQPNFIQMSRKSYADTQSKTVLKRMLKTKKDDDFRTIASRKDQLGFKHEKFQQFYKGIKVEFSTYTVHSKNGKINTANGQFKLVKNYDIKPKLNNEQAFKKALDYTAAKSYMWEYPEQAKAMDNYTKPKGELVILPLQNVERGKENTALAYKFDIFAAEPLSRGYLYIDANTGEVLLYNAIIKHLDNYSHGKKWNNHTSNISTVKQFSTNNKVTSIPSYILSNMAETRYSGIQSIETKDSLGIFTLNDGTRKIHTRNANNLSGNLYVTNYDEFTDNDNNWTHSEHSLNKDDAALDAHWAAEKTYDYFKSVHNRDSYDGNGIQIRNYVHVGNNYNNAFWNGSVMAYGDGSSDGTEGNGIFDALTSIDIGAHEIAHAICTHTANLVYQRESGAMNEGFSDIWGATVENYAKGNGSVKNLPSSIWIIGDEIDRRTDSPGLRSMSDPKSLGYPDTYEGINWKETECGTPTKSNDYCGVHTNSSILNHWFYILTEGKIGTNDLGTSYNVTGIGIEKAAKIAYRLESVYLSPNSNFQDARKFSIIAAEDLYGIDSPEVSATKDAFNAIGVGPNHESLEYCISEGSNGKNEYMQTVKIGGIDNTSDEKEGYSDYTSISTSAAKGETLNIAITPIWTGIVYNEGYSIWIDYNNDGDFEDENENVWSNEPSKDTIVLGSFTIPNSATEEENLRMRVSMKYNKISFSPCEIFSLGEVEDYTLRIDASPADTEVPTSPSNLTVSNITTSSLDLDWSPSIDNLGSVEYDIFQNSIKIGTTKTNTYNLIDLLPDTTYSLTISARDLAGNTSELSNPILATTKKLITYCQSTGTHSNYEWIDKVMLGGVDHISDGSSTGYSFITNQIMNISKGSNRINVSAGFKQNHYTESWKAWIDYNQNGIFENDEIILDGKSTSSDIIFQDFNVPNTALTGTTRLRVSMKFNESQTPCETFYYGEVEDYKIDISENNTFGILESNITYPYAKNIKNEKVSEYISLYPSPVKEYLNIKINTTYDNNVSSYRIFNFTGKLMKTGKINSGRINMNGLSTGVYIIEINDGQKLISKKIIKQ